MQSASSPSRLPARSRNVRMHEMTHLTRRSERFANYSISVDTAFQSIKPRYFDSRITAITTSNIFHVPALSFNLARLSIGRLFLRVSPLLSPLSLRFSKRKSTRRGRRARRKDALVVFGCDFAFARRIENRELLRVAVRGKYSPRSSSYSSSSSSSSSSTDGSLLSSRFPFARLARHRRDVSSAASLSPRVRDFSLPYALFSSLLFSSLLLVRLSAHSNASAFLSVSFFRRLSPSRPRRCLLLSSIGILFLSFSLPLCLSLSRTSRAMNSR